MTRSDRLEEALLKVKADKSLLDTDIECILQSEGFWLVSLVHPVELPLNKGNLDKLKPYLTEREFQSHLKICGGENLIIDCYSDRLSTEQTIALIDTIYEIDPSLDRDDVEVFLSIALKERVFTLDNYTFGYNDLSRFL
jgi:hypothetical protein